MQYRLGCAEFWSLLLSGPTLGGTWKQGWQSEQSVSVMKVNCIYI